MTIAVYCEPLGVKTSGNSGRGMLKALVALRNADQFILVVRRGYQNVPDLKQLTDELLQNSNCSLHVEPRSRRQSNVMALFGLRNYCRLNVRADTFVNMDGTPLGRNNRPLITTVADLSVFASQSQASFESAISYRLRKRVLRWGLSAADEIIAISEATKSDILECFEIPEQRVHVVYNGISPDWFGRGAGASISEAYWIWWGHISGRKNLERLIFAYAVCLQAARPNEVPRLMIIYNNEQFPARLNKVIHDLQLDDQVIIRRRLPQAELIGLVANSRGLLFPSSIEGFGLPIAEAMATGVPVLTSNISATKEIAGEDEVLCDPFNIGHIASGLRKMLDPGLRSEEARQRRKQHAARFTYEKAAKGYSNIIDKVVSR